MTKQIPTERFELDAFQTTAVIRSLLNDIEDMEDALEDVDNESAEGGISWSIKIRRRTIRDIEEALWQSGRLTDKGCLHEYDPDNVEVGNADS